MPQGWYADKREACLMLYRLYADTDGEAAHIYLTRSLGYAYVTPQALCLMGDDAMRDGRLLQATLWYRAALECPREYRRDGFVQTDFEEYYPSLSLCVCFDRLGERETAAAYNERAALVHPDSEKVRYNRAYFSEQKEKETEKNQNKT